jgi:pilus assembly protein CpaE
MIRLLLTETAPGAAESIRAMLAAQEEIEAVGYPRDGLEAAQMAVRLRPDVLLVHDRLPEMTGIQTCELVAQAAPDVACALLCEQDDPATLRRAMRGGARAVVTTYSSPEALASVLRDLAKVRGTRALPEFTLTTDPAAMPQTIALISARDGAGKSTLAANLAALLVQEAPDQVALVDLCGQFGAAALLLNLKPTNDIMGLANFQTDLDLDLVETFMEHHSLGIRVLAGGTHPDPAWTDGLSINFVAALLGLLRRRFRFVILDIPPLIWPGSLYAISRAQAALLITGLCDVTGLRETAAFSDAICPSYMPRERLRLIVNRSQQQEWFSEADVRAATGQEIWHSLPHDASNVFQSANEGTPIVAARPGAPFAKGCQMLARKLVSELRSAV